MAARSYSDIRLRNSVRGSLVIAWMERRENMKIQSERGDNCIRTVLAFDVCPGAYRWVYTNIKQCKPSTHSTLSSSPRLRAAVSAQ